MFNPESISNWISLSAAALIFIFSVIRVLLKSKLVENLFKKDTLPIFKSILNKIFIIGIVILLLAALINIIEIFYNEKTNKVISDLQQSQRNLQKWAFLDIKERELAIDQLKLSAEYNSSYETLILLGTNLLDVGQYKEANHMLLRAINKEKTIECMLNLAISYQHLGNDSESSKLYNEIIEIKAKNTFETILIAKAYHNLSSNILNDFQTGQVTSNKLNLAKEFIIEAEKLVPTDNEIFADILSTKALLFERMELYNESIAYYRQAILLKEGAVFNDPKVVSLGISYNNLSSLLLEIKEPILAETYSKKAIDIFGIDNISINLAFALYNYAESLRLQNNYKDAMSYFNDAKEIFNKYGVFDYNNLIEKRITSME